MGRATGDRLVAFSRRPVREQLKMSTKLSVAFPAALAKAFHVQPFDQDLAELKEKLLTMASHAESGVRRAIEALGKRDYDLALLVQADDAVIDRFELEVDDLAIKLLAQAPRAANLRLITVAMKISQNLERVGDETTTIARRVQDLCQELPLKVVVDIPRMANLAVQMLKSALDAFVNQDPAAARALIPQDKEIDSLNKQSSSATGRADDQRPRYCAALLERDGDLEEPRTHRRPRQERGRGSGLSLRGAGHPSQCRHRDVTCLSPCRHCRYIVRVVSMSSVRLKILVVDDEPEAVELLEFNLKQAGFECHRGHGWRPGADQGPVGSPQLDRAGLDAARD